MTFKPFADDAGAVTLGDLTVENGTDGISFSGTIRPDRDGLAHARRLQGLVDAIVADLSSRADLPARHTPVAELPTMVDNPFAKR